MILLDNAVVREDWKKAKSVINDAVEKHGGKVSSSRRWDERRLAYPIKNKNRATYVLCYLDIPGANLPALRRELELSDRILRYLLLRVDEIPAAELELTSAEEVEGFTVPPPPADDIVEPEAPVQTQETLEDILAEGEMDDRPRGRRTERASAEVSS
jgi:small subunit ribosomal protein S6